MEKKEEDESHSMATSSEPNSTDICHSDPGFKNYDVQLQDRDGEPIVTMKNENSAQESSCDKIHIKPDDKLNQGAKSPKAVCKDTGNVETLVSQSHEDSAISSDMSMNTSALNSSASFNHSNVNEQTCSPSDKYTERAANDSGIHFDKPSKESDSDKTVDVMSSNGILGSSKMDIGNHTDNNVAACSSDDLNDKGVHCKHLMDEKSDKYEKIVEDMITEEMKQNPPPVQPCDSSAIGRQTVEEQMSTESIVLNKSSDKKAKDDQSSASNSTATASPPENRIDTDPPASDGASSDELDTAIDNVIRLRRRLRRRRIETDSDSSDSDTDSDDDGDLRNVGPGDVDNEDGSDEAQEEEEDDDRPPAKDAWHQLLNLRAREQGFSNRRHVAHMFRTKCGSSLSFVQRMELHAKLDYHKGCVNALHFNRSGTLLASGSDDLEIAVWDWRKDSPYFIFESGHRSNVFQCKFMPYTGDSHIVSCARDGQIRLAELSTTGVCKGTKKLAQHRGSAHKLALLEDSSHELYSCGEDAVVFQIDLREPKPQKLCTAKEKERKVALYSIHANPFKSYEFCTGGRDHFIRVYDKRMVSNEDGECTVKKFCPHHLVDSDNKANVTCAVYNWNGTEVLGTYNDDDIYMFDNDMSEGAEYIHRYRGHRNNATVKGVNYYGPKSEYIVSGSDCGNVFLWERNTERIVNFFHADTGGVVNVLEPHPHMPMLATSGLDSDVKLFMPTAKEKTTLKGLAKRMKKNQKEREEERSSDPDMMDGRMLWFLMQHLRRVRRSRPPGGGDGEDNDTEHNSESEHDSDNDSHNSDDENPVECMPS